MNISVVIINNNNMKNLLLICLLCFTKHSYSQQNTKPVWCKFWNEKKFTKKYTFDEVPKYLYEYLNLTDSNVITDRIENFSSGCTLSLNQKSKLFNWIATNNKNQWILSITYGGKRVWTTLYYIDLNSEIPKFYSKDIN